MKTIGVIGAGFYGAYIALKLADKGHKVIIFDPEDNTQSATLHCQARLHSGMFYVRSLTDLKSCARNFTKFFKLFKSSLLIPSASRIKGWVHLSSK